MSIKAFEPQAFERAVIDALRAEMLRQHMSRRTLADRTGISKSRVIRLFAEDGPLSPVTLTVLESVCAALRVPMSTILARAERAVADSSPAIPDACITLPVTSAPDTRMPPISHG